MLGWLDTNLVYLILRMFDGAEQLSIINEILPSSFHFNEADETSLTLTRLDLSHNCKAFLNVLTTYRVKVNVHVLHLNERSLEEVNAVLLHQFYRLRELRLNSYFSFPVG